MFLCACAHSVYRPIRIILGITNRQQWSKHITMAEVRRRGHNDYEWQSCTKTAGHLSMTPDNHLPNHVLFACFLSLGLDVIPGRGGEMLFGKISSILILVAVKTSGVRQPDLEQSEGLYNIQKKISLLKGNLLLDLKFAIEFSVISEIRRDTSVSRAKQ